MNPATPDPKPPRALSLRAALALLLAAAVLAAGGAVALLAWWQARDLLLEGADREFAATARQIEAALHDVLEPVASQLESLALQPPLLDAEAPVSLRGAPLLRQMLRAEPQVDAVFVGGDDGSFVLLRSLADPAQRERLGWPAGAAFLAQVQQDGVRRETGLDAQLAPIAQRPPAASSFDPRERPWFKLARLPGQRVTTPPYVFFTTGEPGVTIAVRSEQGVVLGADISLASLSELLAGLRSTPSMRVLLLDPQGQVVARAREAEGRTRTEAGAVKLARLGEHGDPLLDALAALPPGPAAPVQDIAGRDWKLAVLPLRVSGAQWRLALAAPVAELVAGASAIRDRSLAVIGLVLVAGLAAAWLMAGALVRRLDQLTGQARAVRGFDFAAPPAPAGRVRELNQLAAAMALMQRTIRRFLEITGSLASERQLGRLVARVAQESGAAMEAEASRVWLPDAAGAVLTAADSGETLAADGASPEARAWRSGERVIETAAGRTHIALPLAERAGERVGVLSLVIAGARPPGAARLAFVEQLAGASAVAIETRRLLDERKALLDGFIRVLAGAIDAKSAHTGAHCQRVPELTLMLARAACAAREGAFADYTLAEPQWEALEIAAWLHDCGKVTTPEYVVDKATKLETLTDRLHEVRMRFEVIKRDAEIAHWQRVAAGGDAAASRAQLAAEHAALEADYAFVAACNVGGESLAPEAVARLHGIAARTWQRTLDDRIGLGHEEAARREARPLPASEALLADAPHHRIARSAHEAAALERAAALGMKLAAPEWAQDRGELHNLAVARGTLTPEERYLINHHIVQTVLMLGELPLPRHLAEVPEMAGGHHEKVDGSGIPRGLKRSEMSVAARMMAIADIFEALTASDRPYKTGKPLSEALAIMARMSREGHIDAELFDLFIGAGVWRDYAARFLRPEQIDLHDESALRECLGGA